MTSVPKEFMTVIIVVFIASRQERKATYPDILWSSIFHTFTILTMLMP